MKRVITFAYGVSCYVVFLAVFVYAIGFVGGLGTPTSLDMAPTLPPAEAVAIDAVLLLAFALQHSVMARRGWKRWWTRLVPVAAERSTYVLCSSIAMAALFVGWCGVGPELWRLDGPFAVAVIAVYLGGWALVLVATFQIDHFDLFGLAQSWRALRGQSHTPPVFRTPALYRVVRHPLYVGWLVVFWAAPTMTLGHLLAAVAITGYILIAIRFEERDLLDAHGADYAGYRERVPMLVPRMGRAARTVALDENGSPAHGAPSSRCSAERV